MKRFILWIGVLMLILIFGQARAQAASPPAVAADGAVLIDMNSGSILYQKNKDTKYYPASTTKIMTALLVLERCGTGDVVTVGKTPSSFVDGSKIYVFLDERMTVDQMLHALLIESANDVAIALAEHVSGSEAEFAKLMTRRAMELGCKNTNFANSNGLDDENHYTTAYDLSLIAMEAMKNQTFRDIVSTKKYTLPPTNRQSEARYFYSNNRILLDTKYHVEGADGVKVGYTDRAGHSFVGSATRGNMKLMVVLLHDNNKPGMWKDAKGLLEYGFNSFKAVKLVSAGDRVSSLKDSSTNTDIPLVAQRDLYYTYPSDQAPEIDSYMVPQHSAGSIRLKGQDAGELYYQDRGKPVGSVEVVGDNGMPSTVEFAHQAGADPSGFGRANVWITVPVFVMIMFTAMFRAKSKRSR